MTISSKELMSCSGASYRQMLDQLPPAVVAKICFDDRSGCWMWTGALGAGGKKYAMMTYKQKVYRVHCFIYKVLVGPVPDGLELDHLCCETHCVNPAHLEPVTHQENIRRYYALAETCKHGHPWTEENIYRRPSRGRRECRACNRETARKRYQS